MEFIDSSSPKSKCDFCNEEVSLLTKKLQKSPTAHRLEKFGLCSVSCTSHISRPADNDKETLNENSFYANRDRNADYQLGNIKYFYDSGSKGHIAIRTDITKIEVGQRMIIIGKVLSAAGIIGAIILFYNDHAVLALSGLITLLIGVMVCRLGVWKKCRAKL